MWAHHMSEILWRERVEIYNARKHAISSNCLDWLKIRLFYNLRSLIGRPADVVLSCCVNVRIFNRWNPNSKLDAWMKYWMLVPRATSSRHHMTKHFHEKLALGKRLQWTRSSLNFFKQFSLALNRSRLDHIHRSLKSGEKKPTNFVKVASRSSLKLHRLLTFIEQKKRRVYVISYRTYRIIGIDSSELLIGSRSRSISFLYYMSKKESEISMVIKSLCSLVILQNWYLTVHAAHTALASLHVVSASKADKVHWVAHGV